jgi:hypothetical protein
MYVTGTLWNKYQVPVVYAKKRATGELDNRYNRKQEDSNLVLKKRTKKIMNDNNFAKI